MQEFDDFVFGIAIQAEKTRLWKQFQNWIKKCSPYSSYGIQTNPHWRDTIPGIHHVINGLFESSWLILQLWVSYEDLKYKFVTENWFQIITTEMVAL